MSALDPRDLDRFGKILGLLGSDHLGERAAAAAKATEFLFTRELAWSDIANALKVLPVAPSPPTPPVRPRAELLRPHQRRAMAMLLAAIPWDKWERGFLESIRTRRADLTGGQRAKLDELCAKSAAWHSQREQMS